jgi:hypothetical protein
MQALDLLGFCIYLSMHTFLDVIYLFLSPAKFRPLLLVGVVCFKPGLRVSDTSQQLLTLKEPICLVLAARGTFVK